MKTQPTPWQAPVLDETGLPLSPNDVLELARQHPAYPNLDAVVQFEDAPIQNKTTLFQGIAHLLEGASSGDLSQLYVTPTGGTGINGHSVFIAGHDDNKIQRHWLGNRLRHVGLIPSSAIVLNLFVGHRMYRSLEIINDFCEQAGATPLPLGAHIENRLAYLVGSEFQATMLAGLPTRLVDFALYLLDEGLSMPLTRILYAGDCIRQVQASILQRAFPKADMVSIFGSAESGIWAYHLPDDPKDVFHFDPRMMHLEIINPEKDGSGEMVLTNLVRRRFPLLRYHTGDRVMWVARGAEKSSFKMLGRIASSFAIGENYMDLNSLAPYLEGLLAFQLVLSQESRGDLLELRVVPPEGWHEDQLSQWEKKIGNFMEKEELLVGSRLEFRRCTMAQLERSPTSDKVIPIMDRR